MLSYRHEFHAGYIGDLVKHGTLSLIIEYLKQKPAPIRYIDTHAGAGLYSTRSAMAEKTGEYKKGLGALDGADSRTGFPAHFPEQLNAFHSVLSHYTPQQQYPGSPLLAATLLRAQDELWLYELHSSDFPKLQDLFRRDRRVHVAQSDGYTSVQALLPVQNARALVLIDPSYELKADYLAVTQCVEQGYRRMPNAVFAIWYPVVNNPALEVMIRKLSAIAEGKLGRFQLNVEQLNVEQSINRKITAVDQPAQGMTATGMLVFNPPWTLAQDLQAAFKIICPRLPFAAARFEATCLKP